MTKVVIHNHLPARDRTRTVKVMAPSKSEAMARAKKDGHEPVAAEEINPGHWIVKVQS